ncbi:MAG: hypothetical protein V1681_10690 [Candidatus Neomarinimicrobiota bacterium]
MYKSLLYKEWLKIRYFLLGYCIIFLFIAGYLFLDIRHMLTMGKPIEIWLYIIQYKMLFYRIVKFIPLLGGILMGLTQFGPEMTKNRFRLSFHLPLPEIKMLLFTIGVGSGVFLIINLFFYGGILLVVAKYFASEIVISTAKTILPWFLSGMAGYFSTAAITVEHSWKYRIVLILVAGGLISLMLSERGYEEHVFVIWQYIIIIVMLAVTIIFPGYRLRKGSK